MPHVFLKSLIVCVSLAFLCLTGAAYADDSSSHFVKVYDTYCVQCHGVNRNGKGINTIALSVQPRDHSDAKGMADIPDEELFKAIKGGGLAVNKSSLMPAWGGVLSDDEIHGLVKYLRQICNCGT